MVRPILTDKKGDLPSLIYAIIIISVAAIAFFFINHVSSSIYSEFDSYFNDSATYNDSQARETLNEVQEYD